MAINLRTFISPRCFKHLDCAKMSALAAGFRLPAKSLHTISTHLPATPGTSGRQDSSSVPSRLIVDSPSPGASRQE